jgi:2-polyprenyl-3-methyl-5-hydroxy-6-metoxy-1,4-benzoquinol methylase
MKNVKKFRKNGRLLDVGCALGFFVKVAQDEGFDAFGVDFSKYAVNEGQRLLGDKILWADIEKEIPFPSNYFDVITAWDVLEHLEHPDSFIKLASRVLKKDGLFFVRTLNYNCLMSRLMRKSWLQMGGEHITCTITPDDLKNWLRTCGLRELEIYTLDIALKPLPDKIRIMEKALLFPLHTIILRLARPLDLGDDIICVSKKTY